jgi:hypothetical protein
LLDPTDGSGDHLIGASPVEQQVRSIFDALPGFFAAEVVVQPMDTGLPQYVIPVADQCERRGGNAPGLIDHGTGKLQQSGQHVWPQRAEHKRIAHQANGGTRRCIPAGEAIEAKRPGGGKQSKQTHGRAEHFAPVKRGDGARCNENQACGLHRGASGGDNRDRATHAFAENE